jgi:hypothetical protein
VTGDADIVREHRSTADWKEVCKRAEMRWMSVETATIQVRARLVAEAGRKIDRLEADIERLTAERDEARKRTVALETQEISAALGFRDERLEAAEARVAQLEAALRGLREALRVEPYHGVKYKILCPRCSGIGEVGPENHDDPRSCPCAECEGLGVRAPVVSALRKCDAALSASEKPA